MSLLETLKAVKDDGFDPKTGKINEGGLLPSGRYPVRLLTSTHDVQPSTNREQVILTLQVTSGDSKDRQEKLFLVFDNDLPEFVVEKNAKILLAIAEFANVQFTNADLANTETTAEALKKGIGAQFLMDLNVVPNKKNPEYPYRNYEFDALPQANASSFDPGEEPLPF